ncbi:TPA: hypothetical protein DCL30_00010 [Candidatus Peribacteria bacterium]|nr:MAG: hypothetical protein A2529_03085 [Candidatus Peribacteria bacterium RIFOXYD2_FULL_58_15]HAI97915.1 hypothetical protein [Candidatus Peribacteria bacterium]HAS34720.1 hypothetical protein [Candidatus Peribacteria bacterium]
MRRLLFALLGTAIATILLGAIFRSALLPYEWGCDDCTAKINHLRDHRTTYDTFIFGDSRVLGHIDPEALDQEVGRVRSISSFNFGIASLNPLETLYLYEHLLRDDNLRPRFVLFQVNLTPLPEKIPYNTSRRYWMTLPLTSQAMRASRETSRNAIDLLINLKNYAAGCLIRFLGINAVDGWRKISLYAPSPALLGRGGRGFRILDDQMHQEWLQERVSDFHKNTKQYSNMTATDTAIVHPRCIKTFDAHLRIYERLMRLSEEYGIYPIFFPPFPAWNEDPLCILKRLPPEHQLSLIRMADAPQVFTQDQFVYSNHLNERAARMYTRLFAKTFSDLLKRIGTGAVIAPAPAP